MRIILRPILFLGFIQILRVESLTRQDTSTEIAPLTNTKASSRYRDPLLAKIWPNRTSITNEERIKALAIALQNADKVLNGKRTRKNEHSEKSARVYSSTISQSEALHARSDEGPIDSPRRNVRLRSRTAGRYSTPSAVLLPPYKSYTPEFNFENEKNVQSLPPAAKDKLVTTELPADNATFNRTTSSYPLKDEPKNFPTDERGPNENNIPRYFSQQNDKSSFGERGEYPPTLPQKIETTFPPYWSTTTSEPLKIRLNANATESNYRGRGSAKYNQNANDIELSKKKDLFSSEESGYYWGRRPAQNVNHYKFVDTAWKVGAIPGVPGRDYPVHQHHAHNQLRYPSSRFICPVGPGTHVYLADRASRCQIFYVCYGEKIGVPMMCPNGTLFSEQLQVCDWWFNVAC
ncbi:uncharacterized protein LOC105691316 [Athalia rosae]|uniref:uncharacterized protein LOC105691316 n=1 Tax=Athalia rosae TaxID=37344 RepID=UPI002033D8D4|nr:uncharacterized protein LOC105691316 [Athalia rosae]